MFSIALFFMVIKTLGPRSLYLYINSHFETQRDTRSLNRFYGKPSQFFAIIIVGDFIQQETTVTSQQEIIGVAKIFCDDAEGMSMEGH